MSIKRRVAGIFAGFTLGAASLVVTAAPANAALNCTTGYNSSGWAWGKCLTGEPGGNQYRVVALCQNVFTKEATFVYGNVVNVSDSYPSTIDGCGLFESFYGTPWTQTMW